MSATLYALVVLQGTYSLTFSPGYTTAAECSAALQRAEH